MSRVLMWPYIPPGMTASARARSSVSLGPLAPAGVWLFFSASIATCNSFQLGPDDGRPRLTHAAEGRRRLPAIWRGSSRFEERQRPFEALDSGVGPETRRDERAARHTEPCGLDR